MATSSTGWSIGEIYKKSWNTVWHHKVLWILGMAGAIGGQSMRLGNRFSSSDTTSGATDGGFPPVPKEIWEYLRTIVFSVPLWVYVLLGISIILIVLVQVFLAMIYTSWSEGMLLAGTHIASEGKAPTISQSSHLARRALRPLFLLNVIPGFILGAIPLIVGVAVGFLVASKMIQALSPWFIVGAVIVGTIGLIALVIWSTYTSLALIWAKRRVLIDHTPVAATFWSAWRVSRSNLLSMLGLGFVNFLASIVFGIVVAVPLLVGAAVGVAGYFVAKVAPGMQPVLVVVGGVLFSAYMIFAGVAGGAFEAFKASVWTLAYHTIKGEFHE